MKYERNWGQLGMKSEWKMKKLSELAIIQTGPFGSQLHKEDYVKEGTPMVTVEHLGRKRFTEQNLPCVSDADRKRLEKYVLKFGDIVFSRVGSVDRCSFVSSEYEGWMFSGRCLRVRPCKILNSEYLYYYFQLEKIKQFVRNIATGATMPSINTKFMGEIPIIVPPLDIQEKITRVLRILDEKIDLNLQINKNLYKQMLFIFNNAKKTSSWKHHKLGDVLTFYDNLRKPLSSIQREKMAHIYPYYGATSIVDYVEDYLFDGTYILISEDGANVVDALGHPLTQYTYGKFWVNNHAHVARGSSGYSEALIYAMLGTLNMQSIVTGAAQPKINQANLRNFETVLPENEEAQVLSVILTPMLQQMLYYDQENERLSTLRDTLLPQLMSGELDISAIDL